MSASHAPKSTTAIKRCAIYTRKSHEEGLEQDFNSLDAQRESGVAYIKAQQHEGWQLMPEHYDDGGYSGGSMERPALKRLLTAIQAGHIDVIVVYKVDRLSRALADFAQMIQLFDQHHVSFVSVTQQFNTTTSMGRLTLNVLLSFAQFEREVTGERIRDKIAASKQKGLWMGGRLPLGYSVKNRQLIPITKEVECVKAIFTHYCQKHSLLATAQAMNAQGHRTKQHIDKNQRITGNKPFTPKAIYKILTNPLYIGQVAHKGQTYPGRHVAIIEQPLWQQAQQQLKAGDLTADKLVTHKHQQKHRWLHPYLLKGKLKTGHGATMSPTSVQRSVGKSTVSHTDLNTTDNAAPTLKRQKRLVPYYVSQHAIQHGYKHCEIKSINAKHLDTLIKGLIGQYLQQHYPHELNTLESLSHVEQHSWLREWLLSVTLAKDTLTIQLNNTLPQWQKIDAKQHNLLPESYYQPQITQHPDHIKITANIQIKRRDGKRLIISDKGEDLIINHNTPDQTLMNALARGFWLRDQAIQNQQTMGKVLSRYQFNAKSRQYLKLARLSPTIINSICEGTQPSHWTVKRLIQAGQLVLWEEQQQFLGLSATTV